MCQCTKRRLPKLEHQQTTKQQNIKLQENPKTKPTEERKPKVQTKSDDTKIPVGNRVAIVVRGWETQPHGKERQVVRLITQQGMRNAERQN